MLNVYEAWRVLLAGRPFKSMDKLAKEVVVREMTDQEVCSHFLLLV